MALSKHVHPRAAQRRPGVAAVELAFTLPLIIFILCCIWVVGRMTEVQQILSNAASEGARRAACGVYDLSDCTQVVKDYVSDAGLPITNIDVNFSPNSDPRTLNKDTQITCSVSIKFSDTGAAWIITNFSGAMGIFGFGNYADANTRIASAAVWFSGADSFGDFPADPDGF